jgi:hypothetical protein
VFDEAFVKLESFWVRKFEMNFQKIVKISQFVAKTSRRCSFQLAFPLSGVFDEAFVELGSFWVRKFETDFQKNRQNFVGKRQCGVSRLGC